MMLQNEVELANTRDKLRLLEVSYDEACSEAHNDQELREAELTSLKRLMNQLKEEIARYEAHHAVQR